MGKVKLGATHSLAARAGPGRRPAARAASSAAPTRARRASSRRSRARVDYSLTNPRKVQAITIRGGAKAKGVGIGATIPQIKAKFPHAKVDHSLEDIGLFTIVRIPKRDGGRIMFGVDPGTEKTTPIGVPNIPICE